MSPLHELLIENIRLCQFLGETNIQLLYAPYLSKYKISHLSRKLTLVVVRHPGVPLPLVGVIVVPGALDRPEGGPVLGARVYVAHPVAPPLAHAELTTGRRPGVVAVALHYGDAGAAAPRALRPGAPLAPSAVYGDGRFHYRHALLVLAPLEMRDRDDFSSCYGCYFLSSLSIYLH